MIRVKNAFNPYFNYFFVIFYSNMRKHGIIVTQNKWQFLGSILPPRLQESKPLKIELEEPKSLQIALEKISQDIYHLGCRIGHDERKFLN